ncbi:MAG: AHH domain-containing protein [Porphyrobacter sp.]|nr:AHH domain-containing protein [Porphyrobacter sp.]
MQRHHLLPRQLLSHRAFGQFLDAVGRSEHSFDDFRRNGLLLPATGESALRLGLPLHRGPHRRYNSMVMERVGQIEAEWSRLRPRSPENARAQALMRMDLLQRALRRRLLQDRRPAVRLNRLDPVQNWPDFTALDTLAQELWSESAGAIREA